MKNLFYILATIILISGCEDDPVINNGNNNTPISNGLVGYCNGSDDEGNLYKTIDGGLNWGIITNNSSLSYEGIIEFPSENIGFFVTDGSGVYKTTDAGISWSAIITDPFEFVSVSFPTNNIGFINGEYNDFIHKTIDEGGSWDTVNIYFDGDEIITFPTTNIGFALDSDGAIYKTTDGGVFWTKICDDYPFGIIEFPSKDIGYGHYRNNFSEYYTYKTTDGGITWALIDETIDFDFLDFPTENIGYGLSSDGELYKTIDGGQSWGIVYVFEEDVQTISFP